MLTPYVNLLPFLRRSVRAAEGARLESVYTVTPYHGFESHLLRNKKPPFGWLFFTERRGGMRTRVRFAAEGVGRWPL